MHPSSNLDREYAVRVSGLIDDDTQRILREGVLLDDQVARSPISRGTAAVVTIIGIT
jgi:16S rRNA U516 pseudouridylate synthase RsuA-like enzyme